MSGLGSTLESANNTSVVKGAASLGLDFAPVVGAAKSVIQLFTGEDIITGEKLSRPAEAAGIALGLIPGGKLLTKGEKATEVFSQATKHGEQVEALAKKSGIGQPAPNFIVAPNGTVFPVPKGATGPSPVVNPGGNHTGTAYTGGSGGVNGQVDTIRIMNPTPARGNSPGYPNGYIKYENRGGQGVDPYSGRTVPNSQSHYPVN